VIRSGSIRYAQVVIRNVSMRVIGSTGIVMTTLDLHAVVGGNEVTNPFVVTEVYVNGRCLDARIDGLHPSGHASN